MSIYNCKGTEEPGTFLMTKFDSDLNLVDDSIYLTTETTCTCPAGVRPSCRHRQMLPSFLATRRIDTPWFFDFDTGAWSQPFEPLDDGVEQTPEAEPELVIEQYSASDDSIRVLTEPDLIKLTPTKPLRRL